MTEDSKLKTVRLNVGGIAYEVARDTLERYKGSMLEKLVSDRWVEESSYYSEPIFIDRNGRLFDYVLDYLRANKLHLPFTVTSAALKEEFEFYGIDADMSKVTEKYGFAYNLFVKEKADEYDLELRAIQIAAFVEYEYLKARFTQGEVQVEMDPDDYSWLCVHRVAFRDRLLDRGLQFVSNHKSRSSCPPYVVVQKAIIY